MLLLGTHLVFQLTPSLKRCWLGGEPEISINICPYLVSRGIKGGIRGEGMMPSRFLYICICSTHSQTLLTMACPDTVTLKNLTGKHRLNKGLSDGIDETLKLQGVGYLKRTAIANFSLTLEFSQHTDDGIEHIDIKQTLSGGFKAPTENIVMDGEEHPKNDDLFGPLIGQTRRVKVDELDIDFLKEEWTEDTLEDGVIYGVVKSDTEKTGKDWVIHLVWGFTIKEGVRKFARRYRFTTKERSEPIDVKLYYDYVE
ncbi:uncharacterized protein EDB91DRAFT_1109964 [Suillus paluster]|uniref:uncharacterized protein n=1 Tax=Suillus paluster TaxID=48578 RepID=UPI001B8850D6|nr:uncharacterized protein EDB91DRAFT_1109964 [Suillus paluster]KAG1749844.1 hypothetical protein EDB91DRAFT_1109964 [Suillus paluster]